MRNDVPESWQSWHPEHANYAEDMAWIRLLKTGSLSKNKAYAMKDFKVIISTLNFIN